MSSTLSKDNYSFVTASSFLIYYSPIAALEERRSEKMIFNENLIAHLRLTQGFKRSRFQIDLSSWNGDETTREFPFRIRMGVNDDVEFAWSLKMKLAENRNQSSITLELCESPYPSIFVLFRLVLVNRETYRVVWDTVGARIIRQRQQQQQDDQQQQQQHDFAFIDSDGEQANPSPTPTTSTTIENNSWSCPALMRLLTNDNNNAGENLSFHIFIDTPNDFGAEEFRRLIESLGNNNNASPVRSPHAQNLLEHTSKMYEQIRSEDCQWADVILVVIDDIMHRPYRFYCHGIVLASHSRVFHRELTITTTVLAEESKFKRTMGRSGPIWIYKIKNDLRTVQAFLRYIYQGVVDLSDGSPLLASTPVSEVSPTEIAASAAVLNRDGPYGGSIDVPRLIQLTKMAAEFQVEDLLITCENRLIHLSDLPPYRQTFARLAESCNLPRLRSVLVTLIAGVKRQVADCYLTGIFKELLDEQETKTFVPVAVLNDEGGDGGGFGNGTAAFGNAPTANAFGGGVGGNAFGGGGGFGTATGVGFGGGGAATTSNGFGGGGTTANRTKSGGGTAAGGAATSGGGVWGGGGAITVRPTPPPRGIASSSASAAGSSGNNGYVRISSGNGFSSSESNFSNGPDGGGGGFGQLGQPSGGFGQVGGQTTGGGFGQAPAVSFGHAKEVKPAEPKSTKMKKSTSYKKKM